MNLAASHPRSSPLMRVTSPPAPAIFQSTFAPRHSCESGVGSPAEPMLQHAFTLSARINELLHCQNSHWGTQCPGTSALGSGGTSPAPLGRPASKVSDAARRSRTPCCHILGQEQEQLEERLLVGTGQCGWARSGG
ncbi:hypothetical protein A0H81_02812 [Grifola frondosa]|uniref:Uncharacterized protein n=1 Tax=Grifola frondosa TaxID=5627 RepID=A0A1C7MLR7_GRIFR|nr:hypothetical protein A0H81_02812 [Grifola frondosa]